jgi:thiamine pyrophosphokinase
LGAERGRFVVFTGFWPAGAALPESVLPVEADFVACADGGYAAAARAGVRVDIVIGDFDSLSAGQVCDIEKAGIPCVRHPAEKDDTDTMLCVKYGLAHGFENFAIVGGIGGDFGHTMANLQLLSFLTDMECAAEIVTGAERLLMADGETVRVRGEPKSAVPLSFCGRAGARFSVLSYAERSSGVSIKNAKYELDGAVLTQSYPVGVSNEFANERPVTVSVRYGRLLVIAGES